MKISKGGDYLLVDTGVAQFRVPDNKVTKALGGPQGRIAGLRTAGDTNLYGANAFIEGAEISSVKTEVLADGPAQNVLLVTFYDLEDITWVSQLTFTSGSPVVKILDTMDLQGAWVIDLSDDMAPDTQFACPWFDWESPNQRGNPSGKPLRAWQASEIRGGEWPDIDKNVDKSIFRGHDELATLHREIREGKTQTARIIYDYIAKMRKTLVISDDPKAKDKESVDKKFG